MRMESGRKGGSEKWREEKEVVRDGGKKRR